MPSLREAALHPAAPATALVLVVVPWLASSQGGYFPTSWGWSAAGLAAVVVLFLAVDGSTDAGPAEAAFLGALLSLTLWSAVSIAWSADVAGSVQDVQRTLVLVAGVWALIVLVRKISTLAIAAACVAAISGVGCYALATRLFPNRLGAYDPVATYRLSQPIGYWNGLGIFVVLGIVLAVAIASTPSAPRAVRAATAAAVVPLSLALFFAYSRASWVSLVCGLAGVVLVSESRLRFLATLAVVAPASALAIGVGASSKALTHQDVGEAVAVADGHRLAVIAAALAVCAAGMMVIAIRYEHAVRVGRRLRIGFGAASAVIVLVVVVAALVRAGGPWKLAVTGYDSFTAPAPPTEKIDLNQRLLSFNSNGRAQLWRVAIESVHGHWLGGTGAGSFSRSWERSLTADFSVQDAHSLYIESLAETGVIGLLFVLFIVLAPLAVGVRNRRSPLVPGLFGAYLAFAVHNGADWTWELTGVSLAGLAIGVLLLAQARGGVRLLPKWARLAGGVGAVVVAAVAVGGAFGNGALARAQSANERKQYATAADEARAARQWMPWSDQPLLALGRAQYFSGQVETAAATFRKATSIDRGDWEAWLDLAAVTGGRERRHSLAVAHRLYPRSPEVRLFEMDVAEQARDLLPSK